MVILYYFIIKFNKFKGLWIIDPPYGLGQEDWDQVAWGDIEFIQLFKKISAIDTRKVIYVICFGTGDIITSFKKVAQVNLLNLIIYCL